MQNFFWRRILWSCVLLGASSTIHAADDVVLIDQNRAIAGNVTPGDDPGFPVTISKSGSYRLAGNLTVPDADTSAIVITADAVTLDLSGFNIAGPLLCPAGPAVTCLTAGKGIGIEAAHILDATRGVRVFRGSVRGMGSMGILLGGLGSSVSQITVDHNAGGGMSVYGNVSESAATMNGSFGIIGLNVRDSSAVENAGDGIIVDGGGVATGNVSSSNGGLGMAVMNGTATGNTIFVNKLFGIQANCPSALIGNTVVGNNEGSIDAQGTGCVQANNATQP
ncbi:MAG TPA: hypothetical protein VH640_18930 [Bryobacteraceae bacterium]